MKKKDKKILKKRISLGLNLIAVLIIVAYVVQNL
ncbi:MAG: hypothetical protein RIQ77_206 [Pseudomonadota bacterium]|jgi:hypothetical protein